MVKKSTLVIVVFIIIIFSALNIQLFTSEDSASYTSISGRFIEEVPNFPFGLSLSLIAFILQWVVLLLIVIYTYSKFIQHKKSEQLKVNIHLVKRSFSKSSTDLDVLYNLLKEKKKLPITTISKLFKITKEKAVEWAKILENHKLAIIEYPAFSDPEVRIYEKEKDEDKQKGKETKQKEGEKTKAKEKGDKGEDRAKAKTKEEPKHKESAIKVPKAPISNVPKPPKAKQKRK